MFHLKLKKSRSYTGYGVTATAAAPDIHIEDEAVAGALEASGYFALCSEGVPDTLPPAPPTGTITAIDAMNITQLRAYAKKNGLDISEAAPSGSPVEVVRQAVQDAMDAKEKPEDPEDPEKQEKSEDVSVQFSQQGGGEE